MKFLPAPRFARVAALLGLPVLVSAQTVLDDFSTDQFATAYVQKNVPSFSSGGWAVTGGALQPDSVSSAGGYAAFVWTGNALQNAGDWFSIDVTIAGSGNDHNGGLSVWTSATTTFDRVLEPRLGYNNGFSFVGSDQSAELWVNNLNNGVVTGPVTLKVAIASIDATNTYLTITLNDADGLIDSRDYTVASYTGPLYVGPSAWQASGGNVAFDNLTYSAASAVPEPSTCAALAGACALGLVARRRRNAKLRTQP